MWGWTVPHSHPSVNKCITTVPLGRELISSGHLTYSNYPTSSEFSIPYASSSMGSSTPLPIPSNPSTRSFSMGLCHQLARLDLMWCPVWQCLVGDIKSASNLYVVTFETLHLDEVIFLTIFCYTATGIGIVPPARVCFQMHRVPQLTICMVQYNSLLWGWHFPQSPVTSTDKPKLVNYQTTCS